MDFSSFVPTMHPLTLLLGVGLGLWAGLFHLPAVLDGRFSAALQSCGLALLPAVITATAMVVPVLARGLLWAFERLNPELRATPMDMPAVFSWVASLTPYATSTSAAALVVCVFMVIRAFGQRRLVPAADTTS